MTRKTSVVASTTPTTIWNRRRELMVCAAVARRRAPPLARCWLRRPAVHIARAVRAGWAQTLAQGGPRRHRRPSNMSRLLLGRWRLRLSRAEIGGLTAHPSQRPRDRVVRARHDALLERDDRVVRDVDVLGTDVRAALGDVAVAEPVLQSREIDAVVGVERMHLERCEPHEVPR